MAIKASLRLNSVKVFILPLISLKIYNEFR